MGSFWSRLRGSSGSESGSGENKNKRASPRQVSPPAEVISKSRERSRGRTRTRTPPPTKLKKSTSREQIMTVTQNPQPNIGAMEKTTGGNSCATSNPNPSTTGISSATSLSTNNFSSNPAVPTTRTTTVPHEFVWRNGGSKVCLTGSFDAWSLSILMARDQSGTFRATINLDPFQKWYFKFVVDGVWRCSLDFASETDEYGNVNNVIYPV